MFYITFIAILIFLFTLFKKKNIIIASSLFATIIMVYLLIDYRVLPNVLTQYNLSNVLYIPLLIGMLNLVFHNFNDLEKTEVGYNVRNIVRMLFPVKELRFICLFFICLLPISNNLLINVLMLYIISRYLHISNFFSLPVIFLGLINKSIISNLYLLDFNIYNSIILVIILIVLAIGLILFVISTDYLEQIELKDILYENKKTIIYTILAFIVVLLSLVNVYSLEVSVSIAGIGANLILSLMSRNNSVSIKQETQQNLNKYPYLVSFFLLLVNTFVVLFPELFKINANNGWILIGQILFLLLINLITTRYMRIDYIDEEDYDLSNYLGIKKNINLIVGILFILIISILVTQSKFNSSVFGSDIYQLIVNNLNNSESIVGLSIKTISSLPFINSLGEITNMINLGINPEAYNLMVLLGGSALIINPITLLMISGLVDIRDKRIIESYYFSLIYYLITVVVIMIILYLV